ncbi:MAG TPA: NUDIX domain-containing protein [Candidatus Binataceae bacterium]|nr:NUDIX domain-containing protein [Candidatus Binataceae bacterium]
MSPEDLLVEFSRFLQRIEASAKTGLAFNPPVFDAERYSEMLSETARLRALVSSARASDAQAMLERWRAEVGDSISGYVTPKVGCGGVVFNRHNELLLIQRLSGGWLYPGGYCDVGLSASDNVAKEVREETGLRVTPLHLLGVLDTLRHGLIAAHGYVLLFLCRLEDGELKPNLNEVRQARFWPLDALPQPMHLRDTRWIDVARQFHFEHRREPDFDL